MTLDAALRRAIRRAPSSMRALARAAGVSDVMLQGIVSGRERATPRVARLVARVLERWATQCSTEAARVRAAVEGHSEKEATR
jgi:lambda repressor-like predicted transcriptional regulator